MVSLKAEYRNGGFPQISAQKREEIVHNSDDGKVKPKKFIPERDQQWFSSGFVKSVTSHRLALYWAWAWAWAWVWDYKAWDWALLDW